MHRLFITAVVAIGLISCNKENNQPELVYPESIVSGKIDGQGINYSGVINDTLFFNYPASSTNRFIDLNTDGSNDFELKFSGSASPGHQNSKNTILAFENCFLGVSELDNRFVDTIPLSDTINARLSWVSDTCTLYNYYWDASGASSSKGLWNNTKDKTIGVKILAENKILYGWIRIEITYGWNLTLIDYACTTAYQTE